MVARPLHDLVKKEKKVKLNRERGESVQGIEREVHQGTSISSS